MSYQLGSFGFGSAQVDPDVLTYNATIRSCLKGKHWRLALHLFASMPGAGVAPDVVALS